MTLSLGVQAEPLGQGFCRGEIRAMQALRVSCLFKQCCAMLPDWREVVVKKEGGGFLLLTVVEFDIQPLSKRQWDEYEGFCC